MGTSCLLHFGEQSVAASPAAGGSWVPQNGGEQLTERTEEKGKWDWSAALESAKHLYWYCSGEAREQAHCSVLLLLLFHLVFERRAAVRSSISSCCSSHIKCLFFLFFSSSGSAWAGLEVVLKKALRKGKGKLWRKSFLLGSDLQALGSYSVQMAFSIRNHPLWRQGLGDTLCSFQLVPEIS